MSSSSVLKGVENGRVRGFVLIVARRSGGRYVERLGDSYDDCMGGVPVVTKPSPTDRSGGIWTGIEYRALVVAVGGVSNSIARVRSSYTLKASGLLEGSWAIIPPTIRTTRLTILSMFVRRAWQASLCRSFTTSRTFVVS
jgi:hypothetical protein